MKRILLKLKWRSCRSKSIGFDEETVICLDRSVPLQKRNQVGIVIGERKLERTYKRETINRNKADDRYVATVMNCIYV